MTTNKPESSHDDKHWLRHLYGGTTESHTEFLLHGHKRVFGQHPSKRSLQNHIVRLSRLIDELRTEQETLQAECEKLRKDAERYRFLRADALSAFESGLDEPQLVFARECVGDYQDCIDAAIDSAMREK